MRKISIIDGLEESAKVIKEGGVIVFPTDTVYGLFCDAENEKAVEKLFKIKKRPKGKPISIFVKNIKMAKEFVIINKKQERFFKKVWPGAVTAVLKPKKNLPLNISQDKNTIGLRIPDHKLTLKLIKKINIPLAQSSANISGKPASTKIRDILKQFKNKKNQPDLILDAGNLKISEASTVVDLTGSRLKILRAGPVGKEELMKYFK